jgi:replicative DNA helicase
MEDIRNSGEIEEKANQIVVLHRPAAEDEQFDFGLPIPTECHLEKNTQGAIGSVDLFHVAGRFLIAEPRAEV